MIDSLLLSGIIFAQLLEDKDDLGSSCVITKLKAASFNAFVHLIFVATPSRSLLKINFW